MSGKKWSDDEIQYLKTHFGKLTCKEIAKVIDRSVKAIKHKFNQLNLHCLVPQVGDKYNKLTVKHVYVEFNGYQNRTIVECKCECNNPKTIKLSATNVKKGVRKDCGCVWKGKVRQKLRERCTTHSLSNHPLYSQYKGMIGRCTYSSHKQFKDYGGRGITVCSEWKNSFISFFNWAINIGWKYGLTIERKDTNGNYCPENCVVATYIEQANNKRSNRLITAFGETRTVAQWSRDRRAKTSANNISERIDKLGWSSEAAITTPTRKVRKLTW